MPVALPLLNGAKPNFRTSHVNREGKFKKQTNQTVTHVHTTKPNKTMKTPQAFLKSIVAPIVTLFSAVVIGLLPMSAAAGWVIDGNTVYFTDHVGYTPDGSAYSGTVALRMDQIVESGQIKIVTTIVSITPEPGFVYSIRKGGGVNGSVEIEFASATCASKFSFLYKPGKTKIDYGVMDCR